MSEEKWLRFREAVVLVHELRAFNDGKSIATVKRAVASGEVSGSYTEQYIIKQEKQAHQELTQSIQQDVARNFKMSGSALNILRSRAVQGAHQRAALRLQLLRDIGSPEFCEAFMSGNIRISRRDFMDWLDHAPAANADGRQKPRRQGGKKAGRVERAARAIWGDAGPPVDEPKVICREIIARLKADEGSEPSIDPKTIRDTVRKIYK